MNGFKKIAEKFQRSRGRPAEGDSEDAATEEVEQAAVVGEEPGVLEANVSDPYLQMVKLCEGIDKPLIFDVGGHHGQTARNSVSFFLRRGFYPLSLFRRHSRSFRKVPQAILSLRFTNLG